MICNENDNYIKKENSLSHVYQTQGIYVFIASRPIIEYTVIDKISNDALEDINNAGKEKKLLGKILEGAVATYENMTFSELRDKMVSQAKKQYDDFDAIIFENKLSEAKIIRFNK
jgi:hypothetical protein